MKNLSQYLILSYLFRQSLECKCTLISFFDTFLEINWISVNNYFFFPYRILFYTTHPAHLITALSVLYIAYLSFPSKSQSPISPLWTLVYLISFSTHFGAQIWMTFVSGLALYFSLPRHIFGSVQVVLFPKYFLLNAILSLVNLAIFLRTKNQDLLLTENAVQVNINNMVNVISHELLQIYGKLSELFHPDDERYEFKNTRDFSACTLATSYLTLNISYRSLSNHFYDILATWEFWLFRLGKLLLLASVIFLIIAIFVDVIVYQEENVFEPSWFTSLALLMNAKLITKALW